MSEPSPRWTAGDLEGYPPPAPGHQPVLPAAYGHDPDRRPGTVTAAAVIALVTFGLALLAGLAMAVVGAIGSDAFVNGFREGSNGAYDNVSNARITSALESAGVATSAGSATVIVLAILVLRRSNVARVLLAISSVLIALVSLTGILSGIALVPLLASITVLALLFVGGANDWFHPDGTEPLAPPSPK